MDCRAWLGGTAEAVESTYVTRNIAAILARNVRAERGRQGWSQSELASHIGHGWKQGTVSALETRRRAPLVADLPLLCEALGVDLLQLLHGADPADLRSMGLG
jgi:transcriptional regulator with XRE-family HTH domain